MPLNLGGTMVETAGSGSGPTVILSGLPPGLGLDSGLDLGGGRWAWRADGGDGDEDRLALRVEAAFSGTATVDIVVRDGGGESARGRVVVTAARLLGRQVVRVRPVPAARPGPGVDSRRFRIVPLAIDPGLGTIEPARVSVAGLPGGARLSAGLAEPGGGWALEASELAGLTLALPTGFTGTMALAIAVRDRRGVAAAGRVDVTVGRRLGRPVLRAVRRLTADPVLVLPLAPAEAADPRLLAEMAALRDFLRRGGAGAETEGAGGGRVYPRLGLNVGHWRDLRVVDERGDPIDLDSRLAAAADAAGPAEASPANDAAHRHAVAALNEMADRLRRFQAGLRFHSHRRTLARIPDRERAPAAGPGRRPGEVGDALSADERRFLGSLAPVAEGNDFVRYVVNHGRFHDWQPLPEDRRPMALGSCFHNSLATMLADPRLTYCEGFAYLGGEGGWPAAVHHAWCLGGDGRVIDVTWAGKDRLVGADGGPMAVSLDLDGSERIYFGVPVSRRVAKEQLRRLDQEAGETVLGRLASAAGALGAIRRIDAALAAHTTDPPSGGPPLTVYAP